MNNKKYLWLAVSAAVLFSYQSFACTGISLQSEKADQVVARSIEWGSSVLKSNLVIVPRNTVTQSQTAFGSGMSYQNRLGYVGLSIEDEHLVVEGLNEKGLSAGLFFFPGYGKYPSYEKTLSQKTLSDMEFVAWVLGSFETVAEAKNTLPQIRVAERFKGAGTVHYRVADRTGAQIVIEIVDGKMQLFDNPIGVLTNAPGFQWHLTNLANYMNLNPGKTAPVQWGNLTLHSPGVGSGMAGLPGDITPSSRFVRAAFMVSTAPTLKNAEETILYSFKILNAFEIPIGLELQNRDNPTGLLSATQWSSAADMTNKKLYYKTMSNEKIRFVNLNSIDFSTVSYQSQPIDDASTTSFEKINIR